MPYLAWSDELDTKIPEIDAQHRVMIDHVNQVREAVASGTRADAQAAMDRLIQCIQRHFAFEERMLEMIDFPTLEEHRSGHREILQRLVDHKAQLDTDAIDPEDILDKLGAWLVDHIRHDDVDFGPVVREWMHDAAPPGDSFSALIGDR
jgi:hemerythrin